MCSINEYISNSTDGYIESTIDYLKTSFTLSSNSTDSISYIHGENPFKTIYISGWVDNNML